MRKKLTWFGVALIVIFLAAQLYRPERSNPAVDESKTIYASLGVPPEVKAILERSCADCHSHGTSWPWYSNIAPTSWLIARDVKDGRSSMNLSTWGTYKKTRQANKLDEIFNEVSEDKMPLKPYRLMHPSAALSKDEIDLLCRWAEKERDRLTEPDSTEGSGAK